MFHRCLGPGHDLKLLPCFWVLPFLALVSTCLGLPALPPVRDASSTGSLSLCSSTPVIASMEECALAPAAYPLGSEPRVDRGVGQRLKFSSTGSVYRVDWALISLSPSNRWTPEQFEPVHDGSLYFHRIHASGVRAGKWAAQWNLFSRAGAASKRRSWRPPSKRRPGVGL